MDLRDQILRRRKDNRWILGGLAVLLLVLTAIYYFLQRSRDLPSDLITDTLIFVLGSVNLVLILAIGFVLLRNIFKLLVERQHRILGSKFKTKLVATYIGLSLVPGLLLFAYGSKMLQGRIDRWFDEPAIHQIYMQGSAMAQELTRQREATSLRDASRVLREISDIDLENPRRRPLLARRLRALLSELELDFLAVYKQSNFVHAVLNSQSGLRDLPEPDERLLLDALRSGSAVRYQRAPGSALLTLAAVRDDDSKSQSQTVVVAGALLAPEVTTQNEELVQAWQGYQQLEIRKPQIERTYRLTFLMVTLLILLASSWVGLYLARRVTVPIQALAEGTRKISEGALDHRVEVEADDELGVLVDSFNAMTAELERNKEELLETNQRLAEERVVIGTVLQNVAAGVISVDEKGRILTFNGAALNMLGQQGGGLVGRPIREAWQGGDLGKMAELFETEAGASGRLVRGIRLRLGGEWKTFEAKVTTMRDSSGQVSGRVMVLEDLTELIKAQQMAAWSDAARRIAHEIKNPLMPIKLSAERLLRKYRQGGDELGAALEEGVDIITREVESMKGMVDEFTAFARMPHPQPTEVDLRKLLEETLSLYEGLKPGVEVESRIAASAKTAWLDGEQLKRVLINLLDNALEATEAPGQVSVSAQKLNASLEIKVADSGRGIPALAKDKLFLPHFSTKGRGTGLGLSIVHRIVSDHHGTIRADKNHPRGTIFVIELPQQ